MEWGLFYRPKHTVGKGVQIVVDCKEESKVVPEIITFE